MSNEQNTQQDSTQESETVKKVKSSGVYKGLAELDAMLENAVNTVDFAFSAVDYLEEAGLEYAQEKIDSACIQITNKINTTLEEKKQEAIKILKAKYKQALEKLEVLEPIIKLLELDISLDTIVNGLKKTIEALVDPYIQPYKDAIEFTTTMVTEVTPMLENIASNSIKLSETPDKVQSKIQQINPKLNCDKLSVSFTPPTIEDILS